MRNMARRSSASVCALTILWTALLAVVSLVPLLAHADDEDDTAPRVTLSFDFNHDGLPDIAEAVVPANRASGAAVLSISLGRSGGGFQPMATMPLSGSRPRSLVAGDFSGDGHPDLIVGDADGGISLFLGNGTGSFTAAGEITRVGSIASMVAADFNHDGRLDLAVSDPASSAVTILLGSGNRANGYFEREWSFPNRLAGTRPHLSAADYDGDHNADLAVVYTGDQDTYDVMLGDGKGHFVKSTALSRVLDPNAYCTP
jgi:hypothetical protein